MHFWVTNRPVPRHILICVSHVTLSKENRGLQDVTVKYGKYKGTLLMAVAQDGNNNIFPVAFALVEGETGGAWRVFLKNLRTHVAP